MKFSFFWCFAFMTWGAYLTVLGHSNIWLQLLSAFGTMYFAIRLGQIINAIWMVKELEKIKKSLRESSAEEFQSGKQSGPDEDWNPSKTSRF